MKQFISFKYSSLYPLIALIGGLIIVIFSLIYANNIKCSYFLIGAYLLIFCFINYKTCLKSLIYFGILGGIFFLITYLISNSVTQGIYMLNRIGAFIVGMLPGISVGADRLTRNLSQIKAPRSLTLGMLIVFSFMPILKEESKRVREGMKARGSYSLFNPRIFYRAFLIPFITQVVDISDTLSLSIETRAFDLHDKNYSVYKKEYLRFANLLFILIIILGVVLTVIL